VKIQSLAKPSSVFTLTFIVVALLIGCTAKTPQGPEPEIRIGMIVYSDFEIERSETVNAAEMAATEVNSRGGIELGGKYHTIKVITEEVRGAVPEESVAAVRRLINQNNVVAIVGPQFSSDAIPAGEIAETSGVPLISPISTNPKTTLGRNFVFRMGFLDAFQGKVAAHFLKKELGLERVAVLYNIADPYSRGIAEVFRQKFDVGGKGHIVAFETYTTDEEDLTQQLERIQKEAPQALYLPNFSLQTKRIAVQAREMGIEALLMGGDGWDRIEFCRMSEFDGAYMTAHWTKDLEMKKTQAFVKEYRERYKLVPGDTAALTYDAFYLIFEAIKHQGQAETQYIRDGLYALGPYTGVGGVIDFVDTGDPEKGAVILRFIDSRVDFVSIVKPE
jgi:branched-chain amino acid transport system substrate-binding protein